MLHLVTLSLKVGHLLPPLPVWRQNRTVKPVTQKQGPCFGLCGGLAAVCACVRVHARVRARVRVHACVCARVLLFTWLHRV